MLNVPMDVSNPSVLVYTLASNEVPSNIGPGDITSMHLSDANPFTSASWFSVQDYGAIGNGIIDDSPFILLALKAANAVPGSVLYFPPPTLFYNYDQTANGPIAITQKGSRIMGSGTGSIINLTGTTGNGLEMTNDFQSIVGINVRSTTLASGAYAICQTNSGFGSYCQIQDSFVSVYSNGNGIGNFASASSPGGTILWNLINTTVTVYGASAIALDLQCGTSGIYGTNFALGGSAYGTSSIGIRLPMSVSQGTIVFSNFFANGFQSNIVISPLSGVLNTNYQFSNFILDEALGSPLEISPACGAVINGVQFNNGWFGSYPTGVDLAFQQQAGSGLYNITFTDCRFVGGIYGLYSQPTNQPMLGGPQFNACIFEFATTGGAVIEDDSQYAFNGCLFHGNTYGVIIGPSSQLTSGNAKTFEACQFSDNTNNLAFQSIMNTYSGKVNFRNCLNVTPMAGLTAPAVPATNVYVENPFPFDCTVHVALNGSTISNVILKDANGNTASTGLQSGSYSVGFGTSIALVYSAGKPAWVWVSN